MSTISGEHPIVRPRMPTPGSWSGKFTLPAIPASPRARPWVLAGVLVAAIVLAVGLPFALGRAFLHEFTQVSQCQDLGGSATVGERARCVRCLSGGQGRTFVWDYTPEGRCLLP